jgi:hypothetical protein
LGVGLQASDLLARSICAATIPARIDLLFKSSACVSGMPCLTDICHSSFLNAECRLRQLLLAGPVGALFSQERLAIGLKAIGAIVGKLLLL